jgi:MFS superfamily sulfate permease-like transporter
MTVLVAVIGFALGVLVGVCVAVSWVNGRVTKHEHMLHSVRGGPKPPDRRNR